jgi:hypothetical protein
MSDLRRAFLTHPALRAPLLIEGTSAAWVEIPSIKRGGAERRGVFIRRRRDVRQAPYCPAIAGSGTFATWIG